MTSRTSPSSYIDIRKYLISWKSVSLWPHLCNIRIFVSQTIKSRKYLSAVTIRTVYFAIYHIDDSSWIIAMTGKASPSGHIGIRKYLISWKSVLLWPHFCNIRVFNSQTIKSRKKFSVIAIRTICFTIYNFNNPSWIITVTSRASPKCIINIGKNLISRKFILCWPHVSNIRIFSSQTIKSWKNFSVTAIRAFYFAIYYFINPSRIIPMASRTSPECHSGIRKDLIRRKLIFVGPHSSNIRIFGSQTIKSRK